jgi:hypothetical protein
VFELHIALLHAAHTKHTHTHAKRIRQA